MVALIRQVRDYNFSAGADGLLESTWSTRAVDSIARADPGTYRSPLAHAHLVVANTLLSHLRRDAAIPHLREAVRLDPKDAALHRNLARALMLAGGQEAQAQTELQEAVRLAPDDPDTHQYMGALLIRMRRPEEAATELQLALKLAPNSAATKAALGVALGMQAGRTDDAITAFDEALRLDPNMRLAARDLQFITAARERAQQDLALRRSSVQKAPSDPEAHYRLALALARLGQIPEALGELQESRKLRPDYGPVYTQLASLHYIQGDYAAAWQEVKKARELGVEPTQEFLVRLALRMPQPK
jgi:Flp pilus assembly protein TadD